MDDSVGCCSIRLNLVCHANLYELEDIYWQKWVKKYWKTAIMTDIKGLGKFPYCANITWESIFPYKGNWAMTLRLFLEIISQNLLRNQNKSSIVLSLKVKIRIAKRWTLLIESVHISHFIRNLGNVCICFAKKDTIIDMRFLTRIFTYRVLKQRLYFP